jgi:hypothetical protein
MTNDPIPALEQALGILQNAAASAATLKLAAEEARGALRAIDEANETAPKRRAVVLANTKPLLADMVASLEAINGEDRTRALQREVAVAVAAALDTRARDAEKAEEARNKARSPFQSQTRRAQELAAAFATYPALATRIGELFVTDIDVRRRAKSAYSSVPRGPSRAVGYSEAFEPPRTIAKPEILQKTILPRVHKGNRTDSYFPGRYGDITFIEKQHIEFGPDAGIVGELAQLPRGAPTAEAVDRAVAKADARLIAEFAAVIAEIAKLKALDASITEADISLRYPDGALIFDPTLFPHWAPRTMTRWITLPDLGGYRVAAE